MAFSDLPDLTAKREGSVTFIALYMHQGSQCN